jgi:arsenite methyltransferase
LLPQPIDEHLSIGCILDELWRCTMTETTEADRIREEVRKHYAEHGRSAPKGVSCCEPQPSAETCCQNYPVELLGTVSPEVANFSLGCGNPVSAAGLQPGETVLDLGSGGGLDCFLAARLVGPTGRVIGVDMTEEMLARARANAERAGLTNVEFRQGLIEALPVESGSMDAVISNCVINLSPDKPAVLQEIARVLRHGGRLAVADIVTRGPLREDLRTVKDSWAACIAGALSVDDYAAGLAAAGFVDVVIKPADGSLLEDVGKGLPFSALISARRP